MKRNLKDLKTEKVCGKVPFDRCKRGVALAYIFEIPEI